MSGVRYLALISVAYLGAASGQQAADTSFVAAVEDPMYDAGAGPVVLIDEGHGNFHTKDGRYSPFAAVLEADGHVVGAHTGTFTDASLAAADVLVISNALHASNIERWAVPVHSAFTDVEIDAVEEFVDNGGGLFLIADHMPMPGAASAMAARFGIDFSNGYAFELGEDGELAGAPTIFRRSDERILGHAITSGRDETEAINQVATFVGSAFPATGDADPLIKFLERTVMLMPSVAWEFDDDTPRADISHWSQGVAIEHGDGRVVIFGEAAMFTAQTDGGDPFGLAADAAPDNQQLLLNIVHWLTGAL